MEELPVSPGKVQSLDLPASLSASCSLLRPLLMENPSLCTLAASRKMAGERLRDKQHPLRHCLLTPGQVQYI